MLDLNWTLTVCAVAAVLAPMSASAEQLAKRGTYSGVYGFYANTGETVTVSRPCCVGRGFFWGVP